MKVEDPVGLDGAAAKRLVPATVERPLANWHRPLA